MAKSNYPNKLDTSVEIPAVRDNIVEIGSDVLNSLRSAVFQIERTLGINPQGAVGNSVAGRIGKALDGNGNILSEALSKAGLLSGPISNEDVSKTAAIAETKLRLNYPTQLLQDEISQLISQLDLIEKVVSELSALFAAHVHPSAKNRHRGIAVTIAEILNAPSPIGITSSVEVTAQKAFEQIYDSHINFDGSDISETNRSHTSEQIYFDNENVAALIDGDDVQEVIEEVLDLVVGQVDGHQNLHHANSILRSNLLTGPSVLTKGISLLPAGDVSYLKSSTDADSFISNVLFLDSPAAPALSVETSDILEITTSSETLSFQILRANLAVGGATLESVDIYGFLPATSESGTTAQIFRNKNRESEPVGLLLAAREYESSGAISFSNADVIQISNPDSANIISTGIRPSEISLTNRFVNISIDGATNVQIDLYDGLLNLAGGSQTIDSIIKAFNEQFAENRLSVTAYRVDFDEKNSSEIALVHSVPSSSSKEYTIKISRGSDGALDSVGFANFEDITVTAEIGSQYLIQGKAFAGLGTKLSALGLTLLSGTATVSSGTVNFEELGVRDGDILVITESVGDDGTYVILDVNSSSFTVDRTQLPSNQWASVTSDSTEFTIYRNSVSLNEMAFQVLPGGASSASIVDVFMDLTNRSIFYKERLTYGYETYFGSESLVAVSDFKGDVTPYTSTNTGTLSVQKISPDPTDLEIGLSLDSGEVFSLINVKSEYVTLYSGKYNLGITVFIKDSDQIASKIVADGTGFSISLFGYSGPNEEENLLLGRVLYEAGNSRIAGAGQDYPRPFGKLRKGSIGIKDIGTDVLSGLCQVPLLETRSNGVIRGLEVTQVIDNGTTYTVSISSGVCYVHGKRFELDEVSSYITDIETGGPPVVVDKFYVGINQWGEVIFRAPDPAACDCPFSPYDYAILASAENDGVTIDIIDFRLFIDNLDLRILNSITVSPQPGMGHFTDINKALKYAKRFSQAFPKAGVPTVHLKSGTHQIITEMSTTIAAYTPLGTADIQPAYDGGIWLNFPVNLVGEGPSTVIDLVRTFTDADITVDSRDNAGVSKMSNWIYVAGAGLVASTPDGDADVLTSGIINIRDLKLNLSGIMILDPTIEAGAAKLNNSINIDNVVFDESGKAGFDEFNYGVLIQGRDTAAGSKVGNISITNCEFLNSHIKTNTYNAIDHFNISISNNRYRGSGDGVVDGENHYAIYTSGTGDIFDIVGSAFYNNIEFRGNTASDSSDSISDPSPDGGGVYEWGDRISRSLSVGGRIGVGLSVKPSYPDLTVFREGTTATTSIAHFGDIPKTLAITDFDTSVIEYSVVSVGSNANSNKVIGRFQATDDGVNANTIIGSSSNHRVDIITNGIAGLTVAPITQYVGIGSQFPGNPLLVQTASGTADAADGSTIANHHLLLGQNGDTNGTEVGIGFIVKGSFTFIDGPAAAITLERVDADKGNLHFKTKDAAAPTSTGYPAPSLVAATRLSIGYDGSIGIGEAQPKSKFVIMQDPILLLPGAEPRGVGLELVDVLPASAEKGCSIYYRGSGVDALYFEFTANRETGAPTTYTPKAWILATGAGVDDLDFTGQHRSDSDERLKDPKNIGLIVSSLGIYKNLKGSQKASINEALPMVDLSRDRYDKKVYGVISDIEDDGDTRKYSVGAFVSGFDKKDNRLIINAVGEGGIWISNINGNLENGDFITTCEIPGYGMKQDGGLLHNYTVAKITCDCNFELDNKSYNCLEFEHDGQTYRKAFVGCTYHCG
jgi:hypothetical protein